MVIRHGITPRMSWSHSRVTWHRTRAVHHLDDPDEPAGAAVGGVLLDLGHDDLHLLILLELGGPPVLVVQRLRHPRARRAQRLHPPHSP